MHFCGFFFRNKLKIFRFSVYSTLSEFFWWGILSFKQNQITNWQFPVELFRKIFVRKYSGIYMKESLPFFHFQKKCLENLLLLKLININTFFFVDEENKQYNLKNQSFCEKIFSLFFLLKRYTATLQ